MQSGFKRRLGKIEAIPPPGPRVSGGCYPRTRCAARWTEWHVQSRFSHAGKSPVFENGC